MSVVIFHNLAEPTRPWWRGWVPRKETTMARGVNEQDRPKAQALAALTEAHDRVKPGMSSIEATICRSLIEHAIDQTREIVEVKRLRVKPATPISGGSDAPDALVEGLDRVKRQIDTAADTLIEAAETLHRTLERVIIMVQRDGVVLPDGVPS